MNTGKKRSAIGCFAFGVSVLLATVPTHARAQAQAQAVDPDAVRILKQMTDYLAGLQQFSVRTQIVIEDVHSSGHRVDHDVSGSVTVKRPNKMRLARTGQVDQRFFYDGKTITLYNPSQNVYATKAAPDTLEKMIELARESVGIVLPAADLVYRNAFSLLMQDVTMAAVVDKAVINGVECDHLLFSNPGVDFQVWVAQGKQPWPIKYVVTERDTPLMLSVSTILSDWNTAPDVSDAQFKFVPPPGATAIEFIPVATISGSGR